MVISQSADEDCVLPIESDVVEHVSVAQTLKDCDARKIRIQFGSLSRLVKEHAFYVKESASLLTKIDDMRQKNACIHDVKQMSEVYADSRKMVPQVCVQLRASRDGLFSLLEEHASHIDVLDPACPEATTQLILQARKGIVDAGVILMDSPKEKLSQQSCDSSFDDY